MRVATIDIGTNTVLLLVAERGHGGAIQAVEEVATITRLGEGVDRTRSFASAAVKRTVDCIDAYAAIIGKHRVERIDVVGTSAMRDAEGGGPLRDHIKATLGVDARVISGEEEARLTFRGALSGLDAPEGDIVVFDIGGGSTEFVEGAPQEPGSPIRFAKSFDVGSVRLTERHARTDPPSDEERRAMRGEAASAFAQLPRRATKTPPVGIAGTMTTLAAVHLGLVDYDANRVHGLVLTRAALESVASRLAALPLAERSHVAGLEPKRADVIVAGAEIALAALDALGATSVRISDRGVRWGLALQLFDTMAQRVTPKER